MCTSTDDAMVFWCGHLSSFFKLVSTKNSPWYGRSLKTFSDVIVKKYGDESL